MTKRQIFNGWQKITNTQKTEDWDAQTTTNPDWHELRCSIWVCRSNFTNTTSWTKELGAIALPTFKNWGRGGGQNSFDCVFIFQRYKKIVKIVKKIMFFFLNVKCLRVGYPYWNPHIFFLLKICPVFFTFWMMTCIWCFQCVVFEYLIKRKGV